MQQHCKIFSQHRSNCIKIRYCSEIKANAINIKANAIETKANAIETKANAIETKANAIEAKAHAIGTKANAIEIKANAFRTPQGSFFKIIARTATERLSMMAKERYKPP